MEKKNLVKLQQHAFEIVCKNLGIDSLIVILSTKHDIQTDADRALYSQLYKDMVVKHTYMGCQSLDVTFYSDKDMRSVCLLWTGNAL